MHNMNVIASNFLKLKNIARVFLTSLFFVLINTAPVFAAEKEVISLEERKLLDVQDPLTFVLPLPVVPSTITVGDPVELVYTVKNNVSTAYLPIYTEILNASGVPISTIVTRINIGVGNDCGPQGKQLGPLKQCTITLSVDPVSSGAQSYTLSIDYYGRVDLTTPISFNGGAASDFVYVSNSADDTVSVCQEGTDGAFSNCASASAGVTLDQPAGIAIQTFPAVTGTPYAYVVNQAAETVTKCPIDLGTGEFTSGSCAIEVSGLSSPIGIAFQSFSGTVYAYITDSDVSSPGVTKCTVNATNGTFSACALETSSPFSSPHGIVIQTVNSTDYAYVTNEGTGSVSQCTVDGTTGVLEGCFDSGAGDVFDTPENIAFFTSNALYAYVTDAGSSTPGVWQCTVDSSIGTLSDCARTTGFVAPNGIAFATFGSTNYAFVTNATGDEVSRCVVSPSSGNLGSCLFTSVGVTILDPTGIAPLQVGGSRYMYPVSSTDGSIFQCKETTSTGQLYCIDSGLGAAAFTAPQDLTFQAVSGNTYAYVTDPSTHNIYQCNVNSGTGQLSGCVNAGPLGFFSPFDVVFGTVTSTLYAYVSDVTYGTIFRCDVTLTTGGGLVVGELCNCTAADQNIVSPPYAEPTGISFQTFSSTNFVYAVDQTNNAAYRCTLNGSGLFTVCSSLGVTGLNNPQSIAFQAVGGNTYAYIPNHGAQTVTVCPVNTTTGAFDTCSTSSLGATPDSITFDTPSGTTYAYITVTSGLVEQCTVNSSNGSLASCTSSFGNPISVAFKTITGPETVMYILQSGGNGLELCGVSSGGLVTGCEDSGTAFSFSSPYVPTSLTFGPALGGGPFAYVTNAQTTGSVSVCAWNGTTGAITACVDSGAAFTFGTPTSITFDQVASVLYAYVVDEAGNRVIKCTVNQPDGKLGSCAAVTVSTFVQPEGIAFNGDQAYITDVGTDEVVICTQGTSGALGACANSGVGAIFEGPNAIAFSLADVLGAPNAYITNGTAVSMQVTQCVIDVSTGLFSSCGDSEATDVAAPSGIAFESVGGVTYGYITKNAADSVKKCVFNTSTGKMSDCVDSGAGAVFSGAAGIVFLNPG